MKHYLYRLLSCVLLVAAAAVNVNATISQGGTYHQHLCIGDTVMIDDVVAVRDSIWYDTTFITTSIDPKEWDTIVYTHIVTKHPTYLKIDKERRIERGSDPFMWHEIAISKAGFYEKVYKTSTPAQCDSIYRITVRERVETHVTDTLCLGSSKTFGNQTLTEAGIYRDSLHFADYDSIVILSLIGHKPDTVMQDVRIPEGTSFEWNGERYSTSGVYDTVFTDRFGCDSLSRLNLTVYHVDTIDTAVIVCPGESYIWHGYTGSQTMKYEFPGTRFNGDRVWYRMDLTVKEMVHVDTLFSICDGESVIFNGKTYLNSGEYDDQYTCDTLYKVTVVKHPTKLHVQTVVLDRTNPYYWRYVLDGEQKVDTILDRGIYEHMTHDPETGCNEIYRLIATKDETSYHYVLDTVVCENEKFDWRDKHDLNRQGIGQTTHYFDRYRTVADQDSIYELILKVQPVPRVSQTIKFCGSIEWNGVTITESTVVVDTFASIQYNCDSIVTTYLSKGIPFHKHDTATIHPGESLEWRGHTITEDTYVEDKYVTAAGCDSIYSIGIGYEALPVVTPTRTWYASICEGDYYEWEVDKQKYFNQGTYVDTVWTDATKQTVDSLHILHVTVNEKYAIYERITSHTFPMTYRGETFFRDQTHEFKYTSVNGCDSIITVKAEFEVYRREESQEICAGETYKWPINETVYSESGRYIYIIKDHSATPQDSVEYILNLKVKFIPDTYLQKTICKGSSITFGDQTLSESGQYSYTYHVGGCDSVVHMSLSVVNPDTVRYVKTMNEGDKYTWHDVTYQETGTHYYYTTNRFGCDSVEILQLTVNHVDTIDTTAVICPNELPFRWHTITASQSGKFTGVEENQGIVTYYRLNLTVKEMQYKDTTFTICNDQTISYHGVTYSESGTYANQIACDTIVYVQIINHPQVVYESRGTVTDDHGFFWTYWKDGVKHDNEEFKNPGTYEYTSTNQETGCNDIWRLILTKDENSYHFTETLTICEGDDFEWHGLSNLSNITGTNTYRVDYETHAGKDSTYELTLTVVPVERTVRTITFCGETTYGGKTYTSSAVVFDTISLPTGCYRIERINLDKQQSYYFRESKEWPQGKVLIWHGQTITTDGVYYDRLTTVQGCDSVYELTVTIIPAAPESNQYAEELSACEGDTIVWRGMQIWRSGTYVDTVPKNATKIDSIFTLSFTAWPAPKDTIYQHLYSCKGEPIHYNGTDYLTDQSIVEKLATIHGCDSVVKTYFHFNQVLTFENDTVKIADTELPYRWTYKVPGSKVDTILTKAGTYHHFVTSVGGCVNEEHLVLIVDKTYLFEQDTTICETDLPFLWRGNLYQHEIGTTKQYEERYETVEKRDSIYRLNLTINAQPKASEYYTVCSGKPEEIHGKTYGNANDPTDKVYKDTVEVLTENSICDSVIYVYVTVIPVKQYTETRILHEGETIQWNDYNITSGGEYRDTTELANGCDSIAILRVIQETPHRKRVCETELPFTWDVNGENYSTTGSWEHIKTDVNGTITEYHKLYLTVDTIARRTETYYVCAGHKESIYGKTYGADYTERDTVYLDTIQQKFTPETKCMDTLFVEVHVSSIKNYSETKILHEGETIHWNDYTIVTGGDYRDTTELADGCDSIAILHVVQETPHRERVCETELPFTWDVNGENYNTSGTWEHIKTALDGSITEYHKLYLTVDTIAKRTETYYVCAGHKESIYGKTYGADYTERDTVYLDTIQQKFTPETSCFDTLFLEIHINSVKTYIETQILHEGETIHWNDYTIVTGGDYRDTTELANGCDSIAILHVVQETPHRERICETELPFTWDVNGENYNTTGSWEHIKTALDGSITEYHKLYLTVDTIPTRTIREYVCAGSPRTINNKVYGDTGMPVDTMFRDTIDNRPSPSACDSTIYYEIYVSSIDTNQTIVYKHLSETIYWLDKEITEHITQKIDSVIPDPVTNCGIINRLTIIAETRDEKTICSLDTANTELTRWSFNGQVYKTSGIYYDTLFDSKHYPIEFRSLELTVKAPVDTIIYLHGCVDDGVRVHDEIFYNDTTIIDTIECDYIRTIHIDIHDTVVSYITDTVCETEMPYILGRITPDTIWDEGHFVHYGDTTVYGCDSTIHLTLRIIPDLKKNDSTFICEKEIKENPVVLGDTVDPWFQYRDGGQFKDTWKGKWTGIKYTTDTIVWNCDHSYFHHIIVRPAFEDIARDTFYLCQGDSVQLFWPHKDTWFKEKGTYTDTLKTYSAFTDMNDAHNWVHFNDSYLCDSIIEWTVFMLDTIHKDSTIHIPQGDSVWFNNEWLRLTGDYDSISYAGPIGATPGQTAIQGPNGLELPLEDSRGQYCKYTMTLHLFVDSVYRYNDTITICEVANKDMTYVFNDEYDAKMTYLFDDHFDENNHFKFNYKTPMGKDTAILHYSDTIKNVDYQFYDHYYNLTVFYSQIYNTVIRDTICYGDSLKFDQHWYGIENNVTNERYVKVAGVYHDTLRAFNGCDSIIELHLEVRAPIDTTYQNVSVIDRELPYVWIKTWSGVPGTIKDSLYEEGIYRDTLPSIYGCDSVIVLNLKVIPTHLYRDTIDTCALPNITITHHWAETDYEQQFTTPLTDADTTYKDTIVKNDHDSLFYELLVHFHQIRDTLLFDTICEGGSLRFDSLGGNYERWISKEGRYSDTLTALNGCDSIVTIQLYVRDRIPVTHKSVTITDREAPYYWSHTWFNQETGKDTTYKDTLRTTGEYTYLMPSIHGCDSIDSISFTVHQTHVFRDTITVCSPIDRTLSHVWDFAPNYEQFFTVPDHDVDTTYHDTLPTVFYLDSIYALYVHYHVLDSTVLHTSICEGDSLRFGDIQGVPRFLKEPGVYRDTLTRVSNGCDSIVVMYLNVYQKHLYHQKVDIADIDTPYLWPHSWMEGLVLRKDTDSLYISGEYSRVLPSIYGCDSIDSLSLRIHKTYQIYEDTINICYNQTPFTWQGLDNITETGNYQWGGQTVDGYDSVRYVHINVWKQVYDTISAQICEGDSMRFGFTDESHTTPRFVTTPGLYNDTLQNVHGCDSIIVLRLNVYPKLLFHKKVDIADVDTPYAWAHSWMENGVLQKDTDRVYAAGEYRRVLPSVLGCDSIDSLTLVVHPTYLFHDTVTICYNETPYTWWNNEHTEVFQEAIYETGTYIKRLQTHDYYDSTYVRYVRVIPLHKDTVRHEMCEGSDYLFNGVRYTEDGIYTDTLTTANGCDSIVTLILKVNKSIYVRVPVDIYEGESYKFYDDTYTTSGTYRHYGTTDAGCDSIVELFLTVHKDVDTIVTVCQSELPYTWVNKWSGKTKLLYQAGKYRDDTTYVNGVRTFFTLQLVVNEPLFDTIRTSICEGDDYYFNGVQYKEAGVYRDTLRAANGCDSIETLILTVNKPYYNIIREDILEGSYYVFYGDTLRKTTTVTHGALTPTGCDSTTVLQLTVHPAVDTIATVCRNDLPFVWTNRWNGQTEKYYNAGLYRNDTTIDGQKYFYGLQINVLEQVFDTIRHSMCEGGTYTFKNNTYTEAGIYRDTLMAKNGCDSIVTLILTVNKAYYNIIEEDILEGQYYVFYGDTIRETTTVNHSARTPEGCDSTTVLQLTVHHLIDTIVNVCSNELPYIWTNRWNGNTEKYYRTGLYRNDTTINGKKFFYGLDIHVNEQVFDTTRVAICRGSYYTYQGQNLTEAGIYRDTTNAMNGCDSIHTLVLTVNEPYYNLIQENILEGGYYVFYGDTLRETQTITHSNRTPEGCDSTTVLQLTVHHLVDTVVNICSNELPYIWTNRWNGQTEKYYRTGLYRNDTTINGEKFFYGLQLNVGEQKYDTTRAAICEGSFYRYKEINLYEQGIYRDTLVAANGCDSIHTLVLTVNKPYYNTINEDILEGSYYVFYGDTLRESVTLHHSGRTPEGCDSTTILQLTVHPMVDTVVTVCSNDLPYVWHNRWSGEEEKYYRTGLVRNDTVIDGQKLFYGLDLRVSEQVFDTIRHAMCEGSSYEFANMVIYDEGIYRDTLVSKATGCDSIVTLILTVNKPYYNIIRETILEGHFYVFFGDTIRETRAVTHTSRTPQGCDSTTILELTVHQLVDTVVTICANDLPYVWTNKWNGLTETFYKEGTYRNDTSINGERYFYGLKLVVNNPAFDTIRHTMCEGDYYLFQGQPVYEAGIYRDTLNGPNGCDSIITHIVTVNKPYYNYRIEHILEGDSVLFFNEWYKETGSFTHYGMKVGGCDSTSVLELHVHPMVDTVVTVCAGDLPYKWENPRTGTTTLLYTAGIYRNDTSIVNGERLFYGLQLIVNQTSDTTIYREICEGDSYKFNGRDLTKTGEYRDTIINNIGCDSVIILNLNVLKTYHNVVYHSIFEGDSVEFLGKYYKTAGSYPFRYSTSYGCDSIIELQLTVNRLFDDSVSICANELPYVWNNKTIYESGIYRDTVTNTEGKKTSIGLKVTVLPISKASEPIVAKICEGDFYKFGDRVLTEQGTYYDTLTAENGCDSIIMLALQVLPAKYQTTTKRIFEGDTVFFYGDTLTTSGIYEHRELNTNKCTDTYQLVLTVLKTFNVDTTAVICQNELPFIWRGIEYNETGNYTMPISWNDSSRVVKTLHLTVNETFYGERNVAICAGDKFHFKDRVYGESGEFYDTIPSLVGCDSIIKYIISVHPTYDKIIEKHISDKEPFIFHGRVLTSSGTYEWTGKSVNGCDSMEHLQLTVHPSYFFTDSVDLCQPDTLFWHGMKITQSGTYSDSMLTAPYGFDSVYQIVVSVHPSYYLYEQYEIAEDQTLRIHGMDISKPGIYEDSLRSIFGCDSVYHIVVNLKRTVELTIVDSICQGDYYDFFGKKLTHSGQYIHVDKAKGEITTLNLKVSPISITEETVVLTDKQTSYIYQGKLYDNLTVGTHIFADTLFNKYNCDSISRLIIIVSSHYSEWTPMPLCEGHPIKIDGKEITEAGLYTFLRRSRVTGEMDSIWRVEVYDAPTFEYDITRTICDGDTVFFGDKAITRAGHYDIVLQTVEGCDSIYHLDLTVNPSYRFFEDATITDYQTYTWMGKTYTQTGVYDRTWPTVDECDSTYSLRLNVIPTKREITEDTICDGQEYVWRGKTYTMDGYYTDTVYRPETFYSAIFTLQLTVLSPTNITSAIASESCADDTELEIAFTYSGAKPTKYSIYFNQAAKDEGFVDIINKPLLGEDKVVHCAIPTKGGDVYNGHPYYVRPNRYPVRLVFDNGACGSSSKDSIVVLIKYPSWIIEQNWDDVVAPLKKAYNGGYEFSSIDWYVISSGNVQPQSNNGLGYLHNDRLKPGDEVYMVAKRKGEDYTVPSCPIVIQPMITSTDNDPILVYPSHAPKHAPRITIEAPQGGEYAIYSSMGTYIGSGTLESGKQEVVLPNTSGIYFIRTKQGKDDTTHKVVLY